MSSSALILVNKVLRLTGDAKQQLTIVGSIGGVAERIVEFINLIISDVESNPINWPFLRINTTGIGDGINDTFEFVGAEDVRVGGAVSVWIRQSGMAKELTPEQFDELQSQPHSPLTTVAIGAYYFQRGVSATGKLKVQLYPTPPIGAVINISAFRKATQLTTTDTSTTEFDDDILVLGACMHLDAYDGMERGFASLYKHRLASMSMEHMANRSIQITTEDYR